MGDKKKPPFRGGRVLLQKELLCSFHGNFTEFLEIFHEGEGSLAGACTGGFVTLYYLSLCILYELGDLCIEFFNKLFHN